MAREAWTLSAIRSICSKDQASANGNASAMAITLKDNKLENGRLNKRRKLALNAAACCARQAAKRL
jgi:hypothetical protein